MRLDDKVALVTGGSRGIGRAIALEFANRGADIAFNYLRNHRAARETQEEIESLGVRCLRVRAHLGDEDKIGDLFEAIDSEFGRLDILVNNAATGVQRPALELESRHWDWTLGVNAKAAWMCAVEASKLMIDGGHVVNITSEGSRRVLPLYFSVGVSKASLEAITRYLAVELALYEHIGKRGIRRLCGHRGAGPFSDQRRDAGGWQKHTGRAHGHGGGHSEDGRIPMLAGCGDDTRAGDSR